MYDSWLDGWKEFIEKTHQQAKDKDILRSDIKGCYQNINQSELIRVVKRNLNIETRTEKLLGKLLNRNCDLRFHKSGKGIPQGHIASGFWADLFLAQFDNNYFSDEPKLSGVEFARYADDFVFAIDSEQTDLEKVKLKLQKSLKSMGLEISEDKTLPQDGSKYISETTLDKELDNISKRFDRIVNKIYKINNQYQNLYKQNEWEFVSNYNRILKLLRIYQSEQWLSRKLYQYTSLSQLNWIIKPPNWLKIGLDWFKSWLNWLKHQELNFPLFPDSLETEQDWLQEFYKQNANWTKELEQLRTDLVELCQTSIKILSPEGNPEQIWQFILGNIQMPFTQGLLREHGKLIAYDGQLACIAIKTEPLLKIAHEKLPEIKAAFEKTLNKKVEVKLEVASTIDQNSTNSQGSVPSLETDESTPTITEAEIKKAKRRLKFSANRLCTLGLDEVADLLATEIIQRCCSDEKCHNLIVIDAIQYVLRSLDRDSQGQSEDTANENEGSVVEQKECSLVHRNELKLLRHYYSKNYPVTESETMVGSDSSR